MFLNSAGAEEPVEVATLDAANTAEDKRHAGLIGWFRKVLGNESDLSFEQIADGLRALLPTDTYPREVFPRYFVWADYKADKLYRQDYSIASDGSLALTSQPVEVRREVTYEPVSNQQERSDPVKDTIIAALNAAGISGVAAMTDAQLLSAFEALKAQPHVNALNEANGKLAAANSKIAGFEAEKTAVENAERDTLAKELATNSVLTVDDFKAMPLARLKELKGNAKAAPITVGNGGNQGADEFAGYDLNKQGA
ncbi:MAG: hypothetical protein EOO24_12185 [Comamonadaceae bacterium]|nr:MAG: hypothetical protein EOO24_12185 [Comamonadaceae bacterium]